MTTASPPRLVYLYGLAGAGKSWVSSVAARRFGFERYEADDDITPSMKKAVIERTLFTDDMRDEYFDLVGDRIAEKIALGKSLIVTQATYKQRHRDRLLARFPHMELVWVRAPEALVLQRLQSRADWVDADYARRIAQNFEPPAHDTIVLDNDGDERRVVDQMTALLG